MLLPFLTIDQGGLGTRQTISWSVTVYNKTISSQWSLTSQMEPVQNTIM